MYSSGIWSAAAELAAAQHGHITRQQASERGLTRKRIATGLRHGVVVEPHPGVLRFAGTAPSWQSRLMGLTLAGGGSHASHRSAARLHGLHGFADDDTLDVTVARGRYPSLPGAVVHRWSRPREQDHTVVDGISVTGVATTLAQLGAVVEVDELEQALDDALRRGYRLAWIAETAERLHRPGPVGTGRLLRLLDDPVRRDNPIVDSAFERITERLVRSAAVPSPSLQHPVTLPDGNAARIDIAWPAAKWGIECHSRRYHFGRQRVQADHDRDHQLSLAGWQVAYLTWAQAQQPAYVVDLAERMLATKAS